MHRTYKFFEILLDVCDRVENPDKIFIRRWGTRNNFKAYRVVVLIKRYCPTRFYELFSIFTCDEDDYACLSRAINILLRKRIKSFNNISTLGGLCREIRKLVIRESI